MVNKRQPGHKVASKIPPGVKIISIYTHIAATLLLIGGLTVLFEVEALAGLISLIIPDGLSAYTFGTLGTIFIISAAIEYTLARGLWKLRSWARIITIIIALIALVASVFTLFQTSFIRGWVDLVINGTIAYYLWLSPAAIKAFK